jgi:two-component system response regulator AlgR
MNVLIVDDEPQARERLSRMVSELEGYTVLEPSATNGEEALALIDSLKPDVVLLDIRMPGLDGLQVAARLSEETPPSVVFCAARRVFRGSVGSQWCQFLVKPATGDRCSRH